MVLQSSGNDIKTDIMDRYVEKLKQRIKWAQQQRVPELEDEFKEYEKNAANYKATASETVSDTLDKLSAEKSKSHELAEGSEMALEKSRDQVTASTSDLLEEADKLAEFWKESERDMD